MRRGISAIIVTLILVLLSVVLVGVVWGVVNNMINKNLDSAGSCFGAFDLVTINSQYTCYDSTTHKLRFSLVRNDKDIDGIVVGVSSEGTSKTFTITDSPSTIENVAYYSGGGTSVEIPAKNSGVAYTYAWSDLNNPPTNLNVAPVVGSNTCPGTDGLSEIVDCISLAS